MLASQRIESVVGNWFSSEKTSESTYDSELPVKRGAIPTAIEWMILAWVKNAFYSYLWLLSCFCCEMKVYFK